MESEEKISCKTCVKEKILLRHIERLIKLISSSKDHNVPEHLKKIFESRFKEIDETPAGKYFQNYENSRKHCHMDLFMWPIQTPPKVNQQELEDNLVLIYLKITEMIVHNILSAAKNIEKLMEVSEIEKHFSNVAFGRYIAINAKKACPKFKELAKEKGLFLNFARKEIRTILAQNDSEIFIMADFENESLSQKVCLKWEELNRAIESIVNSSDYYLPKAEDNPEVFSWVFQFYMAQYYKKVEKLLKNLFGEKIRMAPLKSYERISDKILEGKNTWSILDYIRGSYLAESPDEMASFIERVKNIHQENKDIVLKRLKNGFKAFSVGIEGEYPRILMNLMVFNTIVIELQVTLPIIRKLAKVDHIFYELERRNYPVERGQFRPYAMQREDKYCQHSEFDNGVAYMEQLENWLEAAGCKLDARRTIHEMHEPKDGRCELCDLLNNACYKFSYTCMPLEK